MAQIVSYDLAANTVGLLLPQFRDKSILEAILKGAAVPSQDIISAGFDISKEFSVDTNNDTMLNLIGTLLNVPRDGTVAIEDYRQSIKTKIPVNRSTGSAKTLIPLLNDLVGEGNFTIREQYPAEINVRLYTSQTVLTKELINELLPIGVNGIFFQSPYTNKIPWEVSDVDGPPLPFSVLPDLADISTTNMVMIDLIFT
mgnify:CR=1 FL=1